MRVIYGLVDPRDNKPFYVGQTSDVTERFMQHLRCDGSNYRRDMRITELRALHMLPIMVTLEVVTIQLEADVREAYWINHYLHLGIMLTNNSYPTPLEQRSIGVQKKIRARIRELKKEGDLPVATVEERRALVLDLLAKNWGKGKIIEKSMG